MKTKTIFLFIFSLALNGCSTPFGQSVTKWEIAHRPQIEQTAFLLAKDAGQIILRAYLGGTSSSNKFTFANALRSVEGHYTSPDQIKELASTWGLKGSVVDAASALASDLANNPPTTQATAMARLEGYIAAIAPVMGVTPPAKPVT